MKLPALDAKPREHAGLRVEAAMNGFIVYCTADLNHVRGQTFVAAENAADLNEVIRHIQNEQRRAILEFFYPNTAPEEPQPRHERAMRAALAA
jgi:hypothetical protein